MGGSDHLLQDFLFFLSLEIVLGLIVLLQNLFLTDQIYQNLNIYLRSIVYCVHLEQQVKKDFFSFSF